MTAGTRPGERGFAANALVTVIAWFVPALAALIAVPITVRGLGADAYGLLALISAFTGYLGLMEMGLGQAIIRYIAYYRALDLGATVVAITRVATAWFAGVGVIGAILLFALAPWLVEDVLKVPIGLQPTAVTVVQLSSINFFLGMLISVASAIPQAFLRFDISGLLAGTLGTAAAVGPAVLVSLGYGLVAIMVFSIVSNALALVVYVFFILKLYRGISRDQGPPWKSVRRQVLSFAGITALTRIHGVIAQQTNRLVVGIAGGTAEAAYYQVPSVLSSRVNEMLSRVALILFPTGSQMFARNDDEGVRALYYRTSRLFFLVNATVTMGMCVFAHPLIQYWISPEFANEGSFALAIFTFTQMLNATTMSAAYLNLAGERPGVNLGFSLAGSAINLALVYPLTVRYGVPGAAAAGLAGAVNVPFFLAFTHRRVLHVSSPVVFRRCYLPTIAGSALCGVTAYFVLLPLAVSLWSTLALWTLSVLAGMLLSGIMGAVSREDVATGRRFISSARARLRRD